MSWHDEDGTDRWAKRIPILVDHLTGGSPNDVVADLSTLGDYFWDAVRSDGFDIRVTTANGVTPAVFERVGFNKTTRVGTIEVDNVAFPIADCFLVLWLYFDHSGTPSDLSTVVDGVSPQNGRFLDAPAHPAPLIVPRAERRGATRPQAEVTKTSPEIQHIWWDVRRLLRRRETLHNGSRLHEEIETISFEVLRSDSDQPGLYAEADTRMVHPGLIRTTVQAGTTLLTYTPSLTVRTTLGRTLNPRCLLRVQNVDEGA